MRFRFIFILTFLIGCAKTQDESNGMRLTQSVHQTVVDICGGSGIVEHSGFDNNYNGTLDESEIDAIKVTCDVPELPPEPIPTPDVDVPEEHDHGHFRCKKHNHHFHCKRRH